MRIVHEIDEPAQISMGASQYSRPLGRPDYPGYFKISAVIIAKDAWGGPDEEIHIEGDSRHILVALKELALAIEECDEMYRQEGVNPCPP